MPRVKGPDGLYGGDADVGDVDLRANGEVVRRARGDISSTIADEHVSLVARDAHGVERFVAIGYFRQRRAVDVVHGKRASDVARAHDER